MINATTVSALRPTPAPDRPPPKRYTASQEPAQRKGTTPSPADPETRRPKQNHDAMSIGALIHPESGVQYRFGSAKHRLPFSSKKHFPHEPLQNWRGRPRELSGEPRKEDLRHLNSRWAKVYRDDAPENIDRVRIEETKNRIIHVRGVHSFIRADRYNGNFIFSEWKKLRFPNINEFYGLGREFVYTAHWEESQERDRVAKERRDRVEKELDSTLDGKYWADLEGRASRRKRKQTVFFHP